MKIISSELEQIAAIVSQYPNSDLKEVAFAGRSNVGKSSFINAFINRKNLARTSSKPGKTRTVNFYKINNSFRLVVILVVDIRHAPSKEDVLMYNWLLEYGFTGYVIATKADKISKGQWNKHIKIIKDTLNIKDGSLVLPFSSDSKVNLEMIHQKIEEILMEE